MMLRPVVSDKFRPSYLASVNTLVLLPIAVITQQQCVTPKMEIGTDIMTHMWERHVSQL
jgi:hypothetical protein